MNRPRFSPFIFLTLISFVVQICAAYAGSTEKNGNTSLPVYSCQKTDVPLSQLLSERAKEWEKAEEATLVKTDTGNPASKNTTIRLLYSSTHIFIRFDCEDDYIWGTYKHRDSPVFNEECVEVFLNPSNSHQYFEINLSPKNTTFESCILTHRTEKSPQNGFIGFSEYNPSIQTRVIIDGTSDVDGGATKWTAIYAIPFKDLYGGSDIIPEKGHSWRANFYRIDAPKSGKSTYDAWSPTGAIDFHRPWKFGFLKFD